MERKLQDSSRSGFTLIEVVGALLIFSIGVLLAGYLSSGLTTLTRDATLRSEVTAIGQQTLDSLDALPYTSLPAGGPVESEVTIEGRTYTRTWTVTQSGIRTKEVLVDVESSVDDGPTFSRATYLVENW